MGIYIGTAGWSYPKGEGRWDGTFYPESLPDRDKLAYYARYFDAVELNSSFYRPPSPSQAKTWAARAPDGFRFTAKLWQKFTHPKMFEEDTGRAAAVSDDDFDRFREGIAPLAEAGRLGPILAQFPPSFKPDDGTFEYLHELIRRLKRDGFQLAVELRHRDWTNPSGYGPRTHNLFDENDVAWVMIDEPKFRTSIGEVPVTTGTSYFRFHGRNVKEWWHHKAAEDRYNYLYSPAEQQQLAADVKEVAAQTADSYIFYNNHYRAKAVVNALELKADLGQPVNPDLNPELLQEYPDLKDAVGVSSRRAD
jgi:uncharacterized protein YecE (DUF72 family)